jgi:hypothetical protein
MDYIFSRQMMGYLQEDDDLKIAGKSLQGQKERV